MRRPADVDSAILDRIPASVRTMTVTHTCPEVTFLGEPDQPDFGELRIEYVPRDSLIELRSLKRYLLEWRDVYVSYERFVDVVWTHLDDEFSPKWLRVELETRPRGGISSHLAVKGMS